MAWLLAFVLLLQFIAAGHLATLGPSHTHHAALDAEALSDFRRVSPSSAALGEPGMQAASRPDHGSTHAVRRHHHPAADTSTVRSADDVALQALDGDEGASSASLAALLPCIAGWRSPELATERAWCSPWAPLSGFDRPPERPPKAG